MNRRLHKFLIRALLLTLIAGGAIVWRLQHAKSITNFLTQEDVAALIRPQLEKGTLIDHVSVLTPEKTLQGATLHYSLQPGSQAMMDKMLLNYKPDYAAFVAMDAATGEILTLSSYSRVQPQLKNLALRATFPAASIFKVVTATAAIEQQKLSPDYVIPFNGRRHTLYKRNVQDHSQNRWTRHTTLREAFGSSINTVFAKLGLFYLNPEILKDYAERFNFNRPLRSDVPTERSLASIPTESGWELAEVASGFTRGTKLSPLQGALIAAAVANDGVMMEPYIVNRVLPDDTQRASMYEAKPAVLSVTMTPESAASVRELMRNTIEKGTGRKSFRQVRALRHYDDLELGGKTGHLTGTDPVGRCDWFVGYARFQNRRIAVAALTINEERWRVKSSYLAARYFEDYLLRLK